MDSKGGGYVDSPDWKKNKKSSNNTININKILSIEKIINAFNTLKQSC